MISRRGVGFCLALWALGAQAAMAAVGVGEEGFAFGRFGRVHLYRETPRPSRVVLFASGDGGWNLGVTDMARALARLDALVVGFDVTHYLEELRRSEERCSYCAADFEALSQYVQKRLDFPAYRPPVLVGYSSGATLVYATLVQAPPGTFLGAISLGFCPNLPLRKPLCRGNGLRWEPGPKGKGVSLLPTADLEAPWIAIQGAIDRVCDPAATEAFVKRVAGGRVVLLPKVGHGFSVQRNWLPQFRDAFARLTEPGAVKSPPAGVADLPLVQVPARGQARDVLVVLLSGDGGWAGIDRQVAGELARHGVGVVGLNSLQYFWTARTPEGTAADLDRILRHYLAAWGLSKAVLVGYSLGADVLPATVNRLAPELRRRLALVALISPSRTVRFEFHLSAWLGGGGHGRPILPEAERLPPLKVLCVYGSEEAGSLCPELSPATARVVAFKGSHHLGGDYRGVADEILKEIR